MAVSRAAAELVEFHATLAEALNMPFIAITPKQGQLMAKAFDRASEHLKLPALGPKASIAWLAGVCGMIYLPKIMLVAQIARQLRAQRGAKPQASGARVVGLDGRPFAPPADAPTPTDPAEAKAQAEGVMDAALTQAPPAGEGAPMDNFGFERV